MPELDPHVFESFFDDAAVFPPGSAPLDMAIDDHLRRAGTALDATVGPLVLPLDEVPSARRYIVQSDVGAADIGVSVVVPIGRLGDAIAAGESRETGLHIRSVELKTRADDRSWIDEVHASPSGQVMFVELTVPQLADGGWEALADAGLALKYRTGGTEAALFPSVGDLAHVIVGAASRQIPFKLTAGLHRPARYTDAATGLTHHGFLTIAVATAIALRGAAPQEVEIALEETREDHLADLFRDVAGDGSWRRSFRSFGTCSIAEPAEGLERLGLLTRGTVRDSIHEAHGQGAA